MDAKTFLREGILNLAPLSADAAARLHSKLRALRPLGPHIFLSEQEFRANPRFKGVNPEPGRNLIEAVAEDLDFIEHDPGLQAALDSILGLGRTILNKKLVCGVPQNWIPAWVKRIIADTGVKNLGPYIRPEFRDVTYFSGIDYHQDLIDWPGAASDFITLYVYLADVNMDDAPLHVLPASHLEGATQFPHELEREGNGWKYTARGHTRHLEERILTGGAGYAALWHALVLHGTRAERSDKPRISIRYLIQKDSSADCWLDQVNAAIRGPLRLDRTRGDLDEEGKAVLRKNAIDPSNAK